MLAPDQHLGAYRLIARIGAGGMGEVWKGEDTRLGRIVAIKVLPAAVAADAEAMARLRREARMAAQLNHPNIAMIHAIEQEGDTLFLVEEFVEGEPLSRLIASRGALGEGEVCRIGRGVADALAEAHAKGIVHRDIKPDNILVNGQRVKVLDFGIAKQVGPVTSTSNEPTTFMTQQGMILGTVHYMSPEQALGKPLDGRSDIFSLGVVLYEAATGRLPFHGETATETMMHIIRDEPEVSPTMSPGMRAIVAKCLRKDREQRFANAEQLVGALEQQMGQATTAPYTAATPVTVKTAPLAPAPVAAPKKRNVWMWPIGTVIALAGVVAFAMFARKPAPKPEPPKAQPAQTASVATAEPAPATTSVSVTAPPPPQIVETATTAAPTVTTATEPPPTPPAPTESGGTAAALQNADQLYQEAMSQIASGDWPQARKTLHRTLLADPHYAKAHFRMGQIAMFNRNFLPALAEYRAALDDRDRLDPRERHLTRLGIAVSSGNREEARKLGREIEEMWPGDPDLERIKREFANEPGRPMRPRWRRP